jgi:hypothetical protein
MLWGVGKKPGFPFVAKSTAHLEPGQFWAVALPQLGYFGCARVLQLLPSNAPNAKRWFLSGLMAWADTSPPTPDSIAGCSTLVQQYDSHVRDIAGPILGHRALALDGLEPWLWLNARDGDGRNPHGRPSVLRGYDQLREASAAEHRALRDAGRIWALGTPILPENADLLRQWLHEQRVRAADAQPSLT